MMKVTEGIEFTCPIPRDKYGEIMIYLRNHFFADEPLNSSIRLCKPGDPQKEMEAYCYKALQDNYSVMACEKKTKEIAGVVLNAIIHNEDNKIEIEELKLAGDKGFKKVFKFLFSLNESVDLFIKYNTCEIFEIRCVSVNTRYRCKGIGNELISQTLDLAQKNGFKVLKTDATNAYSQKLFDRFGFESILEVFYKNHTSDNGEVIFKTTEPHNSLKIMVKCLQA